MTPFLFGVNTVRTQVINDAPCFVAADVCTILGLENNRQALAKLEEDEKGVIISDTLGGPQQMLYVTEPGLYRLIFKSRKAEARSFQRWVFHEVLPAIRRSGYFGNHQQAFLGLIREQLAMGISPDLAARNALALSPTRKELARLDPIEADTHSELDLILSVMEAGVSYTIPEIAGKLPRHHPLVKGKSIWSQRRRIGKILERARSLNKVQKGPSSRTVTYTRTADIIPFAHADG